MDDIIRLIGGEPVDIEQIKAEVHCDELDREDEEMRQKETELRQQANDGIGTQKARSQIGSARGRTIVTRPTKRTTK
jgi:hypothetical protein